MIHFGKGTYNVRDSEDVLPIKIEASPVSTLTNNSKASSSSNLKCIVTFLDDTEHEFEFHKNALGEELLEKVYDHLELIEKDFFGLQFVCVLDVDSGSRMRWLDAKKSIKRQMVCPPYHLFFKVKFYVSDPSKLIEEYTRYQVYLQLRKDILEGKLPCTEKEAAILGSFAAQSELGDYSPEEHKDNYLDSFQVVPHQSVSLTRLIAQFHRHHSGQYPADAEFKFLEVGKTLPLYGFDLYEANDDDDLDILIGVNCSGISIFKNDIILTSFPWAIIVKLSFKRKFFNVQMKEYENGQTKDSVYAFNAISPPNCKMLWKSCIEHHTFFRLIAPPSAPQKSLFNLGSRFRYSGRTEYQSVQEMRKNARAEKNFSRNYSVTHGGGNNHHQIYNKNDKIIECQNECQASSSLSTTSNSSALSATSAADFASRFSNHCRRLLPHRRRRTTPTNIIRRRMNQITDNINPVSALPDFIQSWLPKASSSFKLPQDLIVPEVTSCDQSITDECESAAPSLAAHRRSFASGTTTTPASSSQSVVLRNSNGASTLTVRVRPSSRNSSILGVDDAPSPASAYSNATARSSLILPSSASSSSHYYHSYSQNPKEQQRYLNSSPYDTTATLIPNSSTPINSSSGSESPRIWRSPNHTTNMIINDSNSQACTSSVHHPCNSLTSLTPNSCRKSMVLNGTTQSSNGAAVNADHTTVIKNNYVSNGNGIYQISNNTNSSNNDYPPYNGTVSRRSVINGSSSPYKGSLRVGSNSKLMNGVANGSSRNSISSYSTSFTAPSNGGYENGSTTRNNRQSSPTRQHSNSPTSITSEDSTVVVRMMPDSQDRFGFNVSGGYDRGYPVIVSRVVTGSPADRCHPRLNVGDMVLKINGQDISLWPYERVVGCIRNIRNSTPHGEITLTIKPNVYRCGEVDDNESSQAAPEVMHVAETVPRSDKLAQSLLLLKESLDAGKILRQFEILYRKKPGMTMNDSRLTSNITKNRYRDVVPYDSTRVKLERAPSGDYINANHVNMEIPSSGIVNRYIACQGPLANTSGDFWYMVWEQGCTTIAMLTTLVEKGRVKCHQYWPSRKETLDYGNLQITNVSERIESHGHYREFSIRNKATREERRVTQMQYTAWPDHGVPDSPKHFIDFVAEVRRARNGSLDPIIVHCSAGIGRTGVLILMETASCLIEANEPVYPLDIVRTMRDQRAMLIQTSDQYVFVCESILRAYKEDVIRPLAEYQKSR